MYKENEVIENRAAQDSSPEDDDVRTIDEDENGTIDDNPDDPSTSDRAVREDEEDGVNRENDNDNTNTLIHVKDAPRVEDVSDDDSDDSDDSVKVEPEPDEGRDLEVDILEPITSVEEPEYDGVSHVISDKSRDLLQVT